MPRAVILSAIALIALSATPLWSQGWTTPVDVSNTSEIWEAGQSFTVDSLGKVHITYANWNDSTAGRVYYTHNDTANGSFAAPAEVPIPGYYLYDHTTQLTHTSDDTLHLVVTVKMHGGTGAENVIYLNKPRGGSWSYPLLLTSDTTEFTRSHGIAALPDDSIFVLMVDDNDGDPRMFDRIRTPTGAWTGEETLYNTTVSGRWPGGWCGVIDGDLYVTYDQAFSNSGAFYKVRHNGTWSAWRQLFSHNLQTGGRMAMSRSPLTGEMAAVYGYDTQDGENYGSGNMNFDIYARFSNDNGQTWTPQVRVSPGNSLDRGATCVYDSSGGLHIVWFGQVSLGDYGSALYRKRSASGAWGPQVNVSNNSGRSVTGFQAIQRSGCQLHFVYVNSGSPPSGPGYEDVWHTRMDLACDSQPPDPVAGFSAVSGEERAFLSWTNPSDADFTAAVVRMSTAGHPTSPGDGDLVAYRYAPPGSADGLTQWPLTAGVTCYFSAFAVDATGNWSPAAHATAVPTADVNPPADVSALSAVPVTTQNLRLSWTNPPDADCAGTLVRYSTSGYPASPTAGDGTACNILGGPGSTASFLHENLTVGTTYYYTAFAYDTRGHHSAGAHATGVPLSQTCMAAKLLPDGSTAVDLRNKVVTGIFPTDTCIYVEEPNRTSAIRVASAGTGLQVGDIVRVTGAMGTRTISGVACERVVNSPTVTATGQRLVLEPVGMICRAVGGGPVPPYVMGVVGGTGINNIGSLVRIWGKVTLVLSSYIYVDDGSAIPDTTGRTGVMVKCPGAATAYSVGEVVRVTGIVQGSVPTGWSANRRYIQMRTWDDLVR